MKNQNCKLYFILLDISCIKLFIFVNGFFINNKDLNN